MKSDTLVVTSYPPAWEQLAERTTRIQSAYCKKNGYDYHVDCSDYVDTVWPHGHKIGIRGFIKFDLLLHFLPHYKYVVWFDADSFPTNHDITIEQYRSGGVTTGYDQNGHHTTIIIAHSTDLVYQYFWACNTVGRRMFLAHDWHEMEAMRYFAQTPPYKDLITYYSAKELCSILADEYVEHGQPLTVSGPYKWEPGDWILHLSALPLQRRIERATEIGERLGLL